MPCVERYWLEMVHLSGNILDAYVINTTHASSDNDDALNLAF